MTSDRPNEAHYPRAGDEFGDYLIGPELGRGAMGVVFEATDLRLRRTVALKLLPPGASVRDDHRQRFETEVSVLTGLGSPHIVRVFDHGEVGGRRYLAMQRIEGTDLGRILSTGGALPVDDALRLAGQLADGLADAHRAGILHRDVKPSNVLVGLSGGEPFGYLCDFGIAKAEDDDGRLTATGGLLGTLGYLAPERARGEPATRASDVYALGCLLWAMLVGHAPYGGGESAVLLAHQQQAVPRLTGVDGATVGVLNEVLTRAMAKRPEDRYAGAEEFKTGVRAAARSLGANGPCVVAAAVDDPTALLADTPVGAPPGRVRRDRRVALAAVVSGTLALGAAAVWGVVALGADPGTEPTDSSSAAASSSETPEPGPDPLGVGFPQVNQACTGGFLVVLVDVAQGEPADVVRNALTRFPDAPDRRYLSTSASCENLASVDGKSRLTALPYLGPFDDAETACRTRVETTDSSTYVIRLDAAAERGFYCVCAFAAADLPELSASSDALAAGSRKLWGIGLQNLMGSVGHRLDGPHTGDYDAATEAAVRGFQTDQNLPPTGAMDGSTWAALQAEVCP